MNNTYNTLGDMIGFSQEFQETTKGVSRQKRFKGILVTTVHIFDRISYFLDIRLYKKLKNKKNYPHKKRICSQNKYPILISFYYCCFF